jgi:probable F420-dependent oxidoreductase
MKTGNSETRKSDASQYPPPLTSPKQKTKVAYSQHRDSVCSMVAVDVLLNTNLKNNAETARDLESSGIDGLFTYEGKGDVFFPLVRAGSATKGMLYTNVAVAIPRSPMHIAYQAWDLQRLTDGRFALGIGSQIRAHIQNRFGAVWESPLGQMREIIEATKEIFSAWQNQTPVDFEGRWTRHTLSSPLLTPEPLDCGPPPIWLAALGPKMTQLAGACADGLLIHPFTSKEHIATHTIPNALEGLKSRGRDRENFVITAGAIVGVHDGTQESQENAEKTVRGMLGFYGSTPAYRTVLETHDWGDLQPQLRQMTKNGQWERLGDVFNEEQVRTLSIIGTPFEAGKELNERFGGTADRLALSIPQGVDSGWLTDLVRGTKQPRA